MSQRWAHIPGVIYPVVPAGPDADGGDKILFGLTASQMGRIRAMDTAGSKLSAIADDIGCSMQSVSRYLRSIGRARRVRRYGKRRSPLPPEAAAA